MLHCDLRCGDVAVCVEMETQDSAAVDLAGRSWKGIHGLLALLEYVRRTAILSIIRPRTRSRQFCPAGQKSIPELRWKGFHGSLATGCIEGETCEAKQDQTEMALCCNSSVSQLDCPIIKVFLLLFLQKKKSLAYSSALKRAALPPAAAVFTETVCSIAKRRR